MKNEDIDRGLIAEAMDLLQERATASTRDVVIRFADVRGMQRIFLYDDANQQYGEVDPYRPKSDTVSNIESFIELVTAEAQRRSNNTGEKMNVIFTERGATFIADTDDRRDVYNYERKHSAQWKALTAGLSKKHNHRDFVLWLQTLQPSIIDYATVLAAFRTLQLNRAARLVSDPLLVDGAKGASYEVKLEVKGGGATATIPQVITVKVPFARGDERQYEFDVQIDIDGGEGDAPVITPYAPAVEVIKEQAIVDEMKDFDDRTSHLPKLTNLVNF